jgi:hypothetical protein
MNSRILDHITTLKPSVATWFSGAWGIAQLAVWRQALQDWSALTVTVLGVPTGIFILLYWALKVRQAWRDRNL